MRKIYFLLFILSFVSAFAQSVNLYNPANNVVYPAQQYFCTGESFNLKVDAVATSTGDYQETSVLPSAFPLSAGSIPITFPATGSNKFSESFPIGFTFSFYGKNYTRVVAGSNGRLVFTNDPELENLKDVNTYIDRTYSGIPGYNSYSALPSTDYNKVYRTNPAQELNLAQIFFGYTDLVPRSQNSSVTYLYKNVTVGGVNGLIVSFQNQIRTNGTGGISSVSYFSNVLLLEDGRMVIYVNNKTEDTYNAILGIQNDDASKFKVPTHSNTAYNYNNGKWRSEGNAWLFTPNQNLTPKFKWFQNANQLTETGNTLSGFIPNDNDVLKVEVTYHDPSGAQVGPMVSDQVTFKKVQTPVITKQLDNCQVIMKVTNYDPALKYEWYRVGNSAIISTNNEIYLSRVTDAPGKFFVRVKKPDGTICSSGSDSNQLEYLSEKLPAPLNFNPAVVCDNSATPAATKTVNLYQLIYPKYDPASGLEKYNVYFYEGSANTLVTNPENYVVNANQIANLSFAVKDGNDNMSCITGGSPVYFISVTNAMNISTCSSQPFFDLKTAFEQNFPSYYTFTYTYADGTSAGNGTAVDITKSVTVKTTFLGASCSANTVVTFTSGPAIAVPQVPVQERCAGADNNANRFDFNYIKSILDPANQYDVKFYNKSDNSEIVVSNGPGANLNAAGYFWTTIIGDYIIYAKLISKTNSSCFANSSDIVLRVYRKPQVVAQNPLVMKNCQGNNVFNLTKNVTDLVNASSEVSVSLEYYAQNGTLLTPAQITGYDAAVFGTKPYIKIIYNPSCGDVVNFDLQFNPKPSAQVSQIIICSELSYSLQNFQNAVISNSSQYTFTDEVGNSLPSSFDVSALPKTVKFLIKDKATGCVSDVQTVTFIKGTNTPLLVSETDFVLCDTDFDGKTSFDLNVKKTVFSTDPNAVFEYFKDANFTQPIAENYTNETAFAQTVYGRITVPGFCPSFGKINLKINTPTKSSTLESKYYICFGQTVRIDSGPENLTGTWSTGETTQTISIAKAGNYSVELTNSDGCTYTHNFTVSDENQPKIEVINQTNNSIEVVANGGVKPYKYYFNGVAQPSNILMNPTAASYEIQVESATGCLGEPRTIYFIKINNAFTPNADGINDVWSVENLDQMQSVSVVIVDRYGNKVFESQNGSKVEWDGKHKGRALPTSTYWYTITWFDAVTQKSEQRQGWILMKNRN
ncbi:T9SS type B sorting domain-containing protein [Kaistella faecalis]|uniref:T9SS type B sorting domain-containing protein n=1 Tax=Kaistella faecalis TaxID=2852098 RepID=UPI001C464044|nr:T9SS type B sorting domain-containing protein [Chryseobacterium faecale]UFK97648.1 T9SS type B sorting domain-containing protein [Chryseobacterium faecale]